MASYGQAFVAGHYAPRADAYLQSAVHSAGQDLDAIEAWLRSRRHGRALDLGCGGGHVTYRAAPHVGEVVACDVTPDMLDIVAREAAARGLANVSVSLGAAERLPFGAGHFDVVLSRFSAHHWTDLACALSEVARVLKPGGEVLIVDTVAPDDAVLDTHLQAIELLRDPSHVRNYTRAEWAAAFAAARLEMNGLRHHRLPLEFRGWTVRSRTPATHVDAIRALQTGAPASVGQHFAISEDGSFAIDVITFEARSGGTGSGLHPEPRQEAAPAGPHAGLGMPAGGA